MASPTSISNTCMINAPPDPVANVVRHKFKQGGVLRFVIDGPPNGSIGIPHLVGLGWIVEAKASDGSEYSVALDSEEFDGDDPTDWPFTPTNPDIHGVELTLEYDT